MRALFAIAIVLLPACIADGGSDEGPRRLRVYPTVVDSAPEEDDAELFAPDDAAVEETEETSAPEVDSAPSPPPSDPYASDPYADPAPDPPPPPVSCGPGTADCNGLCIDIMHNRNACGGCGRVCSSNATGCADGRCTCNPGRHACGLACVDLQANEKHCGSCDHACPTGKSCCAGTCKTSC